MKFQRALMSASTALSMWALFHAPAAATIALDGQLNVVANSYIDGTPTTDQHSVSWSGVPSALNTSASATAIGGANGGDFVTTSGSASATWNSADSGSVTFSNYGWQFSVFNSSSSASNLTQGRGGSDWSYTFTATQNGVITLNYNSSLASGNGFGLWGWDVGFTGSGSGGPTLNASDPTQSGVFSGALVAGNTYTIDLNGNPNISDGNIGNYSGFMNGDFTWSIQGAPAPEAGKGVLTLAVLVLAGALTRARRGLHA